MSYVVNVTVVVNEEDAWSHAYKTNAFMGLTGRVRMNEQEAAQSLVIDSLRKDSFSQANVLSVVHIDEDSEND